MSLIKLTCYCEKWIKKICTKIAILLFTNKAGNGLLSLAQWMGPQPPQQLPLRKVKPQLPSVNTAESPPKVIPDTCLSTSRCVSRSPHQT